MITKVNFGKRISDLRIGGGQNSAREMSLALGQNPSYINRIENGKALPSMQGFFSICEYLQITPGDFFNEDSEVQIAIQNGHLCHVRRSVCDIIGGQPKTN